MPRDPEPDLQRLLAEEPHVRALAQALCADADDVVQQVWLRVLRHRGVGTGIGDARSWLSRIVRNLASNARRDDARRRVRERAAAADDDDVVVPSSQELAVREERRRSLVAAVDRLPREQRTVVLLRFFDGLPPRRIAQRLGVPVTTVWSRLRNALQRLRADLDDEHGDRRAWLVPLTGMMAMAAKAKVGTAAAVLVAAALVVLFAVQGAPPTDTTPGAPPSRVLAQQGELHRDPPQAAVAPATDLPDRERVVTPGAAAPTTGALVVRARRADGLPAAGLPVLVQSPGGDFRNDLSRRITDRDGDATFADMAPGRHVLFAMPSLAQQIATIAAGVTTEVELVPKPGLEVRGVVVDSVGVPIGGAVVEFAPMAAAFVDVTAVAVTAADGTFVLRDCFTECFVAARAEGHTAAAPRFLLGSPGTVQEVRLELPGPGGAVAGRVVGPDGRPAARATVRVGAGRSSSIPGQHGLPPLPALVHADDDGRYRAMGLAAGVHPVHAWAPGSAPWNGECEVAAQLTAALDIRLAPGVACNGIVLDGDGQPVDGARIEVADDADANRHRGDGVFEHLMARTTADGSFSLRGLPAGGVDVRATSRLRSATVRVTGAPGETVRCELRFATVRSLRCRVVDEQGLPVPGVGVVVSGDTFLAADVRTDAGGRFAVPQCPDTVRIRLSGPVEPAAFPAVSPGESEVELRVRRAAAGDARVRGVVVGPDDAPLANVTIVVAGRSRSARTAADGRFELTGLPAGDTMLLVMPPDLPRLYVERDLQPAATLDLGRLQLPRGGTAVFEVGGDTQHVWLAVFDAAGRGASETVRRGERFHSLPLAPGDYHARVAGEGVAMQAVPFAVRAGEETKVAVQLATAVRQRVEFVLPQTEATHVVVDVVQDDVVVGRRHVQLARTEACATELWLAPGRYSLRASAGALAGRAVVTVGAAERPTVRVALR